MTDEVILEVKNLSTGFYRGRKLTPVAKHINFKLHRGETLAIVGESGSGKSVTSLSILRLIAKSTGKVYEGEIFYLGEELLKMSTREMRAIRGKEISMIFQDPMTSLNPTFKIGDQLVETIKLHMKLSTAEAKKKAIDYLALTKLPDPERIMNSYSFELSGGMRQRVMIAIALVCNPKIIIADEPTTALDPTVQAQILDLLDELKQKFETSIILITHDLAVVYNYADYVAVMYAGNIVEYGTRDDIFCRTAHRYTKGLLESIPRMGETREHLFTIPGSPPEFSNLPEGCHFSPRCEVVNESCCQEKPEMQKLSDTHYSECSN